MPPDDLCECPDGTVLVGRKCVEGAAALALDASMPVQDAAEAQPPLSGSSVDASRPARVASEHGDAAELGADADAGAPARDAAGEPPSAGPSAGMDGGPGSEAGGGPDGSTGGDPSGGAGGVALVECNATRQLRNTQPCGTFVSPRGVELQLGPFGAKLDLNVGKGFETEGEATEAEICPSFMRSFGESPEVSEWLLNIEGLDLLLHSVYRPANWPQGKVPIVIWSNGTCTQPEGYGGLLRYVASHGFFVVAPNMRFAGSGAEQRKALDYAFAANADPQSPYYRKLDTDKVIAMGHSQGGLGTSHASSDARIKAAILYNGGTEAPKPFLAISGDRDLGAAEGPSAAMSYGAQVTESSQPRVAWLWYHMIPASGHMTVITQPERVVEATVAWAKYILLGDAESKGYFAGTNCRLCGRETEFRFGQRGIQ